MRLADGFEDALIGYGTQFTTEVAVYSLQTCVSILIDRDGMTSEEAMEFMSFNVLGAYVGKDTPIFIDSDMLEQENA